MLFKICIMYILYHLVYFKYIPWKQDLTNILHILYVYYYEERSIKIIFRLYLIYFVLQLHHNKIVTTFMRPTFHNTIKKKETSKLSDSLPIQL